MPDDPEKELEEARSLPFAQRVAHAKWKVRNEAWAEVASTSEADTASDETVKSWSSGENSALFVAGVNDTNSAAQASALEALNLVLRKADSEKVALVSIHGSAICEGLSSKCLGGRPNTVKRAKEALLLFTELGRGDLVVEALTSFALCHKVSKVTINGVEVLTEALRTYGSKALDPKPLLREAKKLYDAKVAAVRTASKELTAELCRWIPPSVIRDLLLSDVRDAMKKDIESLIAQNEGNKVVPLKALRTEDSQPQEDQNGQEAVQEDQAGDQEQKPALNTFDLAEPVQIFSDLGDFWSGLKAKKWSTRRDALLSLKSKASVPKIDPTGDFMSIAKELKRVIATDSNVSCVNAAIDCIQALAKGLRRSFRSPARLLCASLLEKFKEKSAAVTRSIHGALSACLEACISMSDVQDDLVACIKHKNPKNKVETLKLCAAALEFHKESSAQVHDTVLKEATKATQDSSPAVRDAALALVIQFARAAGGLGPMESYVASIDNAKMWKIVRALSSNEEAKAPSPGAKGGKSPAKSKPKAGRVSMDKGGASQRRRSLPTKGGAERRGAQSDAAALMEDFRALVGEEVFQGLKSTLWKDRVAAMKEVKSRARDICAESEKNLDLLVCALSHLPGWGDSNFQVLLNIFETFIEVVETQGKARVTKENVDYMIQGCVEKIADAKLNAKICDLLDRCAETIDLEFLIMGALAKSKGHKNPKVLSETMEWIQNTLTRTSARGAHPRRLIEAVKANLSHSNPNVRLGAANLLATVIAYRGLENKSYLGEVKPTLMASIDAAIGDLRDKGIHPSSPKKKSPNRRTSGARTTPLSAQAASSDPSGAPAEATAADTQLPSGLLDKLADGNWKTRRGALEEVKQMAKTKRETVKANANGLLASLRLRLQDANKNLVVLTLEILQHLPRCFDKQWDRYAKLVVMEVLRVLCDNKKQVREAGVVTLHSWANAGFPIKTLQPYLLVFVSDAKTNVDGKVSVLTFLSDTAEDKAMQFEDCLADVLIVTADCLLGKALSLRESATHLLKSLTEVFQTEKIRSAAKTMSKTHDEAILAALTKLGYVSPPLAATEERRPRTSVSRRSSQTRPARPQSAGARMTPKAATPRVARAEADAMAFSESDGAKAERARKHRKRSTASKPLLLEDLQRPDHIRTLQAALAQSATPILCDLLFHEDFRKHCTALDVIANLIDDRKTFRGVLDNFDLILQWFSYRICEGNMQVLVKILDVLGTCSACLKSNGYQLTDHESQLILPCLVEKCGHNNDRIRQTYRDLILKLSQIHASPKAQVLMIAQGLASKNHRTRMVCLEVLESLHEGRAAGLHASKVVREVAALVTERDMALRNKALGLMASIYRSLGASSVWKCLSTIPEAARAALEERFKGLEPARSEFGQEEGPSSSARTPGTGRRPKSAGSTQGAPMTPPGLGAPRTNASPSSAKVEGSALIWARSLARASSEDVSESIEGMKQLCHVLLDFAKNNATMDVAIMVNSADKLVRDLSDKVKVIFDAAVAEMEASATRTAQAGSSRGCKYVLNTLMHTFQLCPMAAAVSEPTLRKIMKNLLLLLLNGAIPSLEEGGQLLKALNVLMLKILENGNRTSTFLSLLWLLGEGTTQVHENLTTKFSDLIIKCLIKQTKHLSASIDHVNLEGILSGINVFLCSLDSGAIRNRLRQDDKPLRMVKTILHELCKLKGREIYKFLVNIPRRADKKQLIYTYVDLYVQTTMASSSAAASVRASSAPQAAASAAGGSASPRSPAPAGAPAGVDTRSLVERKEELAGIFKRIGDNPSDKEGLQALHKFQKECPHIEIDSHLSKTSQAFQEYIRNGLKKVAEEDARVKATEANPLSPENKENEKVGSRDPAAKLSEAPRSRQSYSIEELRQRVERARNLLNNSTNDKP